MSTDHDNTPATDSDAESDRMVPGRGDDERENREHIEKTGDPATDALGNADGASLMNPVQHHDDPARHENTDGANGDAESADAVDAVTGPPTDAGHSDAATQTQRNIEDESPA